MTFAIGRRFIIVDGAERWKDKEMDALEAALAAIAPDTTVTFFAREDGRLKAPKRLHDAVKKAGGDIAAEQSVKPWELPKWAVAQARQLGLDLTPEAARMLVGHVGERQQRLLRELEKLALDLVPPTPPHAAVGGEQIPIDADMVLELTAASAERKAWTLADALLSGNAVTATRTFLQMRAQGERLPGLIYWMSSRVRQAHQIARDLDRGVSQAQVKSGLRMPPSAADKLIADAKRIGAERLEQAICLIADLELASRGGGNGGANEDTRALLTISEIAAA
jgi:DNA polymerase-3 subunit delta